MLKEKKKKKNHTTFVIHRLSKIIFRKSTAIYNEQSQDRDCYKQTISNNRKEGGIKLNMI